MASTMSTDPRRDLMNALSTLHLGGKYSDLTVVCNYRQWAVHRAILCSRSGFFDGACSNQFREADSAVIDLSDDDEDAVEQMIHYFYHLDYLNQHETQPSAVFAHRAVADARRNLPRKLDLSQIQDPLLSQAGLVAPQAVAISPDRNIAIKTDAGQHKGKRSLRSPTHNRQQTPPREQSSESEDSDSMEEEDEEEEDDEEDRSHLLLHTRVYALAEKYDIPALKELAKRKFEMAMACYYDSPNFAEAIEEVYCTTIDTDRGLRDVVLQAFRSHPRLANTQDVFAVIKETPSLAFELFKMERGLPI